MISVVSAAEALQALSGGAGLLDVKNPDEGSLGAQSPGIIREIRKITQGRVELSAAIGDMPNLPGTAALAALGAAVCGADYIKVGLHGLRHEAEAIRMLRILRASISEYNAKVIAAAYADYRRIDSLNPAALPYICAEAEIAGCLVDTAIKDGHTVFDFLQAADLVSLTDAAHKRGLLIGIAGALEKHHLPVLQHAGVDVSGLRTAVCHDGNRKGALDSGRVKDLIQFLATNPEAPPEVP